MTEYVGKVDFDTKGNCNLTPLDYTQTDFLKYCNDLPVPSMIIKPRAENE